MKLPAARVAAFVAAPDPAVRAALVHGPDQGLVRERADRIAAAIVPDRIGQILVSSLREQLNPTGQPVPARYVLSVTMSVDRSDLGIRRDNTSTRGELSINATLSLHEADGDKIVYSDAVRTVTSFNLPDDAYAATVAEDTARTEAADELGREIAERLTVFVRRHGGAGA